jgi:hypothetical protein
MPKTWSSSILSAGSAGKIFSGAGVIAICAATIEVDWDGRTVTKNPVIFFQELAAD